jgi:pSer/pThr/pTyr-binding forkhead associated (FHA) protein
MNAALKVLSGPLSGQSVRLTRKLLIGRAEDCDLRLEGDFVSRHHCILLLDEYTLRLRDLGSKNGTFVNGRRVGVSAIILLHDDNVWIGEISLLIDLMPGTEPTCSRPEGESSSTQSDGGVTLDGDRGRADGAEFIPPRAVSNPDLSSTFPAAPDPLDTPHHQDDDHG